MSLLADTQNKQSKDYSYRLLLHPLFHCKLLLRGEEQGVRDSRECTGGERQTYPSESCRIREEFWQLSYTHLLLQCSLCHLLLLIGKIRQIFSKAATYNIC